MALLETGPCARCGKDDQNAQIVWCPAWNVYLCVWCRIKRNDAELKAKPKVNWHTMFAAR